MSASELGCRIARQARQLRSPGYLEELESNPDCIPGRYTYAYVSRLSAQIMRFLHAPCKNPQAPEPTVRSDRTERVTGWFVSSSFFFRSSFALFMTFEMMPLSLSLPLFLVRFTQCQSLTNGRIGSKTALATYH